MDPMTDEELIAYCGFKPTDNQQVVARWVAQMAPGRRAMIDRMRRLEVEANLWTAGLGPRPTDAILCFEKKGRARDVP